MIFDFKFMAFCNGLVVYSIKSARKFGFEEFVDFENVGAVTYFADVIIGCVNDGEIKRLVIGNGNGFLGLLDLVSPFQGLVFVSMTTRKDGCQKNGNQYDWRDGFPYVVYS